MANSTRLVGLKKDNDTNKQLYDELFVSDSGYRLISSSPKVFSAIHPEDFGDNFSISEEELDYYIDGFIEAVTDNVDTVTQAVITEQTDNSALESGIDDFDIKLSLYRSFKSLYDKWISNSEYNGVQTNGYFFNNYGRDDNRMLYEHFRFINRANQDVGKKAVIDFSYLSNLASTQNGQGPTQSLYESLTGVLSKNNFDFWPLPAEINLSTQSLTDEEVKDMFRPLTIVRELKPGPVFACVYIGGSSRSLADLNNDANTCNNHNSNHYYNDDSFDITEKTDWPTEYASTDGGIVAFKVRYGQEAQNHFTSIELDQTEFKETQESLQIIDSLTNPNSGSDPTQIGKGNSMYDVYLTRSYTCKVSGLGNMSIQPLMHFKLENVPMFRGTYLVMGVSHKITPHNIVTEFSGMRQPRITVPVVTEALSLLDIALAETAPPASTVSATVQDPTPTEGDSDILGPGGGAGLEPIVALTVKGESDGGDYGIYNFGKNGGGGIRSSTAGSKYYSASAYKLNELTVTQILDLQSTRKLFAVGKYQTIPDTLRSSAEKLGLLNAFFNQETQDKIGLRLLIGDKRPALARYLKGTNNGTQKDLEDAVDDLGREFASKPIITKKGVTWGDVTTGKGNKGYYGGTGINPDTVKTNVGTVVNALIKSRIQYSSKNPEYIPSYYTG